VPLSGADPLNLAGIVTPGPRLAALAGNRLLLQDGIPIATFAAGEVQFQRELPPHQQWQARNALLRKLTRPGLAQAL
jgi:ATP-dependent Lhr-like helicase